MLFGSLRRMWSGSGEFGGYVPDGRTVNTKEPFLIVRGIGEGVNDDADEERVDDYVIVLLVVEVGLLAIDDPGLVDVTAAGKVRVWAIPPPKIGTTGTGP